MKHGAYSSKASGRTRSSRPSRSEGTQPAGGRTSETSRALRAEDRQWIRDQAKGEFVTDYCLVIESLQEQVRQAELIRSQAERASEKLEATQLIAEIEVQIADLLAQGPTVLGLKAAGERVQATREAL